MTIAHLPLNEIAMEMRSGFACGEEDPQGIAQFRMNNVTRDGAIDWTKIRRVPAEKFREEFRLRDGDILFNATNSPELVGKTAVYAEMGEVVAFSNHFIRVRVDQARAVPAYVGRWLQKLFSERKFQGMCRQWVNQASISKEQLANVCIPLPPLDEQRRIAAILDQADALRRKRCEALKILNRLGDAVFTDTFGDLIANSMEWQSVHVSDICDRITVGVVVKPASYYRETGIPAIRGTNIKASGIDLSDIVYFSKEDNENKLEKSRIWKDDLLIVRSGRPGMTALVTEELHGSNAIDVIIVTPKQHLARPIFLRDFLNSPSGRQLVLSEARGQVQQHFNVKSLSSASIFLPPMAVQVAYETQVRKIDESREGMTKQLNVINNLFASLQHRAFRGEL